MSNNNSFGVCVECTDVEIAVFVGRSSIMTKNTKSICTGKSIAYIDYVLSVIVNALYNTWILFNYFGKAVIIAIICFRLHHFLTNSIIFWVLWMQRNVSQKFFLLYEHALFADFMSPFPSRVYQLHWQLFGLFISYESHSLLMQISPKNLTSQLHLESISNINMVISVRITIQ